jgi:hypothetical protein
LPSRRRPATVARVALTHDCRVRLQFGGRLVQRLPNRRVSARKVHHMPLGEAFCQFGVHALDKSTPTCQRQPTPVWMLLPDDGAARLRDRLE